MNINGKKYKNTRMYVYLIDRFGGKSTYWHRVFEGEDGRHYIKHDGRMTLLSDWKIHSIGNL